MTGPTFNWVPLLIAGTKLMDRENLKSSEDPLDPPKMFFQGKWKCILS